MKTLTNEQMGEVARAAIVAEAAAVARVADVVTDTLPEVVDRVLATAGKVLTTGSGTSSQIARRLAHLLSVSGTPALFIHSMDALHGTVGAVQPGDLLVAISKTGESDEVLGLCRMVQQLGVAVIGLGEDASSTLAQISEVFVCLEPVEGADPGHTLAMGSTLAAGVWGDALTRVLMEVKEWELGDSLARHPAGGVGKAARTQPESGF
ncbi:SIS domain-containing protein [Actinomyces sp. F1_1611]